MTNTTTPIFAVAGKSQLKIAAVQKALELLAMEGSVIGVPLGPTGTNEQPVGRQEILTGAANRAIAAYGNNNEAEYFFGIENGIEERQGQWEDYAIVYLLVAPPRGFALWNETARVIFPNEAVELTKSKPEGFKLHTVGKTLAEMGLVKDHADPHLCLAGKSRLDILAEAIVDLLNDVFEVSSDSTES